MIAEPSCRSLNTCGSSESRNTKAAGYPSDDAPAAFSVLPHPLLSSTPFPPEAPSEENWARFAEQADDGLSWSPNPAAPG